MHLLSQYSAKLTLDIGKAVGLRVSVLDVRNMLRAFGAQRLDLSLEALFHHRHYGNARALVAGGKFLTLGRVLY